jgi:hypothetical protein
MNKTMTAAKKKEISVGQVVERLRRERDANEAAWIAAGKEAGPMWGKQAPYAELRDRAITAEELQGQDVAWDTVRLPEDMDDILRECRRGDRGPGFEPGAFAQGFHEGLLEFWTKVSEQL